MQNQVADDWEWTRAECQTQEPSTQIREGAPSAKAADIDGYGERDHQNQCSAKPETRN